MIGFRSLCGDCSGPWHQVHEGDNRSCGAVGRPQLPGPAGEGIFRLPLWALLQDRDDHHQGSGPPEHSSQHVPRYHHIWSGVQQDFHEDGVWSARKNQGYVDLKNVIIMLYSHIMFFGECRMQSSYWHTSSGQKQGPIQENGFSFKPLYFLCNT